MKRTRSVAQAVLSARDFPGEIVTGVPVVELKGDREAVILSHRGVSAYQSEAVCVASSIGPVRILGKDLRIHRMDRERIVLHGLVRCVRIGEEE